MFLTILYTIVAGNILFYKTVAGTKIFLVPEKKSALDLFDVLAAHIIYCSFQDRI